MPRYLPSSSSSEEDEGEGMDAKRPSSETTRTNSMAVSLAVTTTSKSRLGRKSSSDDDQAESSGESNDDAAKSRKHNSPLSDDKESPATSSRRRLWTGVSPSQSDDDEDDDDDGMLSAWKKDRLKGKSTEQVRSSSTSAALQGTSSRLQDENDRNVDDESVSSNDDRTSSMRQHLEPSQSVESGARGAKQQPWENWERQMRNSGALSVASVPPAPPESLRVFSFSKGPRSDHHGDFVKFWDERYKGLGVRLSPFLSIIDRKKTSHGERGRWFRYFCNMCQGGGSRMRARTNTPRSGTIHKVISHLRSCKQNNVQEEETTRVSEALELVFTHVDGVFYRRQLLAVSRHQSLEAQVRDSRCKLLKRAVAELFLGTEMSQSKRNLDAVAQFTRDLLTLVAGPGVAAEHVDAIQTDVISKRLREI